MQPFWVPYPGLQERLDQLTGIVDRMQAQSEKKYGRSLDVSLHGTTVELLPWSWSPLNSSRGSRVS